MTDDHHLTLEACRALTAPEQVAAAVERMTRFYVIGKLEQVEVHGLPMGLGDSSIIVLQALAQAQADLAAARVTIAAQETTLRKLYRDFQGVCEYGGECSWVCKHHGCVMERTKVKASLEAKP